MRIPSMYINSVSCIDAGTRQTRWNDLFIFTLLPTCRNQKTYWMLFDFSVVGYGVPGLYPGMEEHHGHMGGTPGLYTSGRSTSSSSSPGVAGSSPALLVVPQPINATKMGGMQNGGPQPRKYQCKMCPQVSHYCKMVLHTPSQHLTSAPAL